MKTIRMTNGALGAGAGQRSLAKKDRSRATAARLGDLLVKTGKITAEQLVAALGEQRLSGEKLGRILVRQGALGQLALHGHLVRQYGIRLGAALMALFFGAVYTAPTQARAEEASSAAAEVITLASLSSQVTGRQTLPPVASYPRLFGSSEEKSSDISAFTKWTQVIARFETQLKSTGNTSPRIQMWKSALHNMQKLDTVERVVAVNEYINQVQYITDDRNWSKSDYWATPIEFFSRGGDCEDYAIAKYVSLLALGVPHERMRLAIVHDRQKNIPHAILIVYTDEGALVLDNQEKSVRDARKVQRYQPLYSINRDAWWLHRG